VRSVKNGADTALLFFEEGDVRLLRDDCLTAVDLRGLLRGWTGLRVTFNAGYDAQLEGAHITCMAMSNKGAHVLLGWSDGTVQKRNLK